MLVSERLRYRTCLDADAPQLGLHWNRPEVRRYLWDDEPVSAERVDGAVVRAKRASADFGGGLWMLTVDGSFVGTCGLLPVFDEVDPLLRRALDPALLALVGDGPMVEVIYSLEPEAWGQGFALEATRALVDHAQVRCGVKVVFGGTDLPNERSVRTLRSAGLTEVARFDGDVGPLIYFVSVMA